MLDRLDIVLRAGADQVADTVRAPSAELIRARGDRRRMRAAAGSAVAVVVVLVLAAAAAQAVASSGPAGPVAQSTQGLHLKAPHIYLAYAPNPVSFTIPGQVRPTTVTVQLNLGKPSYVVDRFGHPIVLRRDPVTSRWRTVALVPRHGGWAGGYTVPLPVIGLAQQLVIVPAVARSAPPNGAGRLKVRVLAGRKVIAAQEGPATTLAQGMGSFTDASGWVTVPRGGIRDFTVTVRNPGQFSYQFSFSVFAMLCPGSTCPGRPAGINVQWQQAGRWLDLSQAAWRIPGNGQLLQTSRLAPLDTLTYNFRVLVTAPAPRLTGMLELDIDLDRAPFGIPSRLYPHNTFTVDSAFIDIG